MNVNERIARALGMNTETGKHEWQTLLGDHNIEWCDRCCSAVNTCCGEYVSDAGPCDPVFPDYAGSVDACLPVLADHPEWRWDMTNNPDEPGVFTAWIEPLPTPEAPYAIFEKDADSPAAALAECIALALGAELKGSEDGVPTGPA